jgi:hypothetical protein
MTRTAVLCSMRDRVHLPNLDRRSLRIHPNYNKTPGRVVGIMSLSLVSLSDKFDSTAPASVRLSVCLDIQSVRKEIFDVPRGTAAAPSCPRAHTEGIVAKPAHNNRVCQDDAIKDFRWGRVSGKHQRMCPFGSGNCRWNRQKKNERLPCSKSRPSAFSSRAMRSFRKNAAAASNVGFPLSMRISSQFSSRFSVLHRKLES